MALDPIETGPEVRKKSHHWVDLLLTASAICMSALSLFLAQDTSRAMERLVQANSRPFVQLGSGNASDDNRPEIGFSVSNAGTGPAQIYRFDVLVDGRPISRPGWLIRNMASACCSEQAAAIVQEAGGDPLAAFGRDLTSPVAHTFLAPGEETVALRWERTERNQSLWNALDRARQDGRITMRACYCSLFDECWVAETNVFPPRPVNSCEPEPSGEAR